MDAAKISLIVMSCMVRGFPAVGNSVRDLPKIGEAKEYSRGENSQLDPDN